MSRSEREMAGTNGRPTTSERKVQLHVTTRGRGTDGAIEAKLDLATSRLSISNFSSEEVPR